MRRREMQEFNERKEREFIQEQRHRERERDEVHRRMEAERERDEAQRARAMEAERRNDYERDRERLVREERERMERFPLWRGGRPGDEAIPFTAQSLINAIITENIQRPQERFVLVIIFQNTSTLTNTYFLFFCRVTVYKMKIMEVLILQILLKLMSMVIVTPKVLQFHQRTSKSLTSRMLLLQKIHHLVYHIIHLEFLCNKDIQ